MTPMQAQAYEAKPGESSVAAQFLRRAGRWAASKPVLIASAGLLIALLVALAISIQQVLPAAFIAALVIYVPLMWIYFGDGLPSAGHFWFFLFLLVGLPLLQKITGVDLLFLVQLVLMALAPVALLKLPLVWREVPGWRLFVLLLLSFVALSLISSVHGESRVLPATYQMFTNLKFVIMLLVGFTVAFSDRTSRWFWRTIDWFWLPNALLVLWQLVSFDSYLSFFSGSSSGGPDPLGLLPSRAMGLFQHPTTFGAMMGFFSVCASARYAVQGGVRNLLTAFAYGGLILLAAQRQELFGAISVFLVMLGMERGWQRLLPMSALLVLIGAVALIFVWPLIEPSVLREVESWLGSPYKPTDQPRQVLYSTAVGLANTNFPFGTGLGTFGGAGSVKYNMDAYWKLGFSAYSWIERREFLMDTYWPNFIAEAGWFGLVAMLAVIFALLRVATLSVKRMADPASRMLGLVGLGGILFVFSLTPSSPAFQDPGTFLLPALFVGIAYNRHRAHVHAGGG